MKNKDRLTRSLCAILSATVILMNFQCYQVRAEEKSIRYYSVMDNRDFEVVANVTSVWEHHANVDFVINNVGQEKIDNWYITFNTPYIVEQVWNGTIFDQDENGNFTIKNDVWNQDIKPGESVAFSMTLYSEDAEIDDLPVWYLLNTRVSELPSDRLSIEYTEYTRWEEGFSGAVQILSDSIIEDWAITINSEYELVGVEGAELNSNDDGSYTLRNTDSSQNLSALSPNLFPVIGIPTENDFSIDVVKVESVTVAYMLEEDRDENAIPDYIDYINSIDGESEVIPSPTPTIDIEPTVYPEPTEEVIVEPTSKPEPTVADSADWVDTDGDGLSDEEEVMFGTKADNLDSDGDGIDDYLEISIGYNPLQGDSDGNGILDGDEDFDGDGITNKAEIEEGICIFAPDSDYDGIDDYSELFMYGSDPDSDDSNDDGIMDGDAVKLGFDPSKSDSDGDGIPDCEEKQYQEYKLDIPENADLKAVTEVEIKGEFTNLLSSTTTIEDTWGKDVYSSAIDALVGGLVSIETTSGFDSATLVFHYDENALGDIDEEDLCILWHDEENGKYVMFDKEQVLDKENNTLSLETTHFCSMMVIDKSAWIDTWKKNVDRYLKSLEEYESTHSSDGNKYIFAVQLSGTDSREFRIKQYDAYVKLLSQFSDEDIGGVLVYSGYARGYQGYSVSWYQGFIAYNMFANMDSGEANITQAFSVASDIQSIVAEESDPVVLYVFTSQTTDISLSADDIANINRNGKYTVNIVSVDGLVQSDLSTGGITARVVPCSDPDAFVDLAVEQNNTDSQGAGDNGDWKTKDTDGDGLYDYQEEIGFLLSNGKYVTTDLDNKFTDEDEVDDRTELGRRCRFEDLDLSQQVEFESELSYHSDYLECWDMLSDPTNPDSDGDTYKDDEDAIPLLINPPINYILWGVDTVKKPGLNERNAKRYVAELEKNNMDYICINVDGYDSFMHVWNNLGSLDNSGNVCYSEAGKRLMKYSYVDNLIIISHGHFTGIAFNGNDGLAVVDIDPYGYMANKQDIYIECVDIQSCYSAFVSEDSEVSLIRRLVEYCDVNRAYGWAGQCAYEETIDIEAGVLCPYIVCYRDGNEIVERAAFECWSCDLLIVSFFDFGLRSLKSVR